MLNSESIYGNKQPESKWLFSECESRAMHSDIEALCREVPMQIKDG